MKNKWPFFIIIALFLFIIVGMLLVFNGLNYKKDNSLLKESLYNDHQNDKKATFTKSENPAPPFNEKFTQNQNTNDSEALITSENTDSSKTDAPPNEQASTSEPSPNLLDAHHDTASIEFTLLDGIAKKTLTNLVVQVKVKHLGKWQDTLSLTTNEEGKINFETKHIGDLYIQIFTTELSYSDLFKINGGKNSYVIEMLKGGALEVKVNTPNDEKIERLIATIIRHPRSFELVSWIDTNALRHFIEMPYDPAQNLFLLTNLPVGFTYISFKAPGYEETGTYKFFTDANRTTKMEANLIPARILSFKIDTTEETESTYISEISHNNPYNERNQTKRHDFLEATEEIAIKYQSFLPNTTRETLNSYANDNDNMFKIFRNSHNLFEYEMMSRDSHSVVLFVGNNIPQKVYLDPNKNTYQVSVKKTSENKLILKNEAGEPIVNAEIVFFFSDVQMKTRPDENGVAFLLNENHHSDHIGLHSFHISAKNYAPYFRLFNLDNNKETLPNSITMTIGKSFSGKVLFQGEPVANATVFLSLTGNASHHKILERVTTGENGDYLFNNLDNSFCSIYTIQAFRKDLGMAAIAGVEPHKDGKTIDLNLSEKKSTIRVVDINQTPLKNIPIKITSNFTPSFSETYTTNEAGEIQLLNMDDIIYFVYTKSDQYRLKKTETNESKDVITMTVEPRDLRPLHISVKSGASFQDTLTAGFESRNAFIHMNIITDENHRMYVDVSDFESKISGDNAHIFFKTNDHSFVTKGPFKHNRDIPPEFHIELQEEENFSLEVLDKDTKLPLQDVQVGIRTGSFTLQVLYTNKFGESTFTVPVGGFDLVLEKPGYATRSLIFSQHRPKKTTVHFKKIE